MFMITVNEKRSYKLELEQGGIYGRVWREEGENAVNILISKYIDHYIKQKYGVR